MGVMGSGRTTGYSTICAPDDCGGIVEQESFTCKHCQKIVFVKPLCDPADMGGLCKVCDGLICPGCYAKRMAGGPCDPWEEKMKRMEARDATRRSMGL